MKADSSGRVRIATKIKELVANHQLDPQGCVHISDMEDVIPSAEGCEDCLKIGDNWVHLRICLECGHVGCCDSSKNKHATKHFHETNHPMIASYETGEDWVYCYLDEITLVP